MQKEGNMAEKLTLVDDFDGDEEGVTRRYFSFDNVDYEIDLSEANYKKFAGSLKRYIEFGRKRGAGKKMVTRTHIKAIAGVDNDTIREWARANGHEVSDKGRIRKDVMDAFNAAHAPIADKK